MKRHSKIILVAMLIAASATSCSEDKINEASASEEEKTITLTGYYGDKDSSQSFNNDEKNFYWDDEDIITLWNASGESANVPITSGGGTKLGVFSGRVSNTFNPAYVTFAKSVSETTNNQTKSVSVSSISPILYSAELRSLPDLSYSIVTIEDGKYTFNLNHKMAYVYLKSVKVDGVALTQVKVSTNTGNLFVNASGLTAQTKLSAAEATVKVGTIIPVLPTIFGATTTDGTTTIFANTTLAAGGFYTIDKNITTNPL